MNLIFQVATGEETRTIWHGSLRFKIIMLTVAGYFAQYIFFLWLKTTYATRRQSLFRHGLSASPPRRRRDPPPRIGTIFMLRTDASAR